MSVLKSFITLALLAIHATAVASPEPQWPWQSTTPRPAQGYSPRPTAQPTWGAPGGYQSPRPRPDDDDDEPAPKWTPPPQWGPKGTRPFGPRTTTTTPTSTRRTTKPTAPLPTSFNSDQIPTTLPDIPKEPVPFGVVCQKKKYDEYDVSNALTAGCFYWKKGTKIANTEFPKAFPNSQRFDFGDIKGPFFEFPLIESAPFVSGDPGLDRVVFSTPDCFLAGELTTRGQAKGQYTECSEEY